MQDMYHQKCIAMAQAKAGKIYKFYSIYLRQFGHDLVELYWMEGGSFVYNMHIQEEGENFSIIYF